MESQFRALDAEIEGQPLPCPYNAWRCMISCNDCSAKSNVPFHFLGMKCDNCSSYNTSQIRMIRPEDATGSTSLPDPSHPQPISPTTGMERIRSLSTIPALAVNSPPRAASTEHGNALDDDSTTAFSSARGAIAAADQAIQIASGLGEGSVDDGWDSENSADFLDDEDDEDDEDDIGLELGGSQPEDESSDEEEELINLRGHI